MTVNPEPSALGWDSMKTRMCPPGIQIGLVTRADSGLRKAATKKGWSGASATLYLGSGQIFCQQVCTDTSIPEYSALLWDTLLSVSLRTCKM